MEIGDKLLAGQLIIINDTSDVELVRGSVWKVFANIEMDYSGVRVGILPCDLTHKTLNQSWLLGDIKRHPDSIRYAAMRHVDLYDATNESFLSLLKENS